MIATKEFYKVPSFTKKTSTSLKPLNDGKISRALEVGNLNVTIPPEELAKQMGMSESLAMPDVRKKVKLSSRDSNATRNEKFSLLLKGPLDSRKSKESTSTFKKPKLQNYQSAAHLSHRQPANSV